MKKKNFNPAQAIGDFIVDLAVHGLPMDLLTEFASTIVTPFYLGNLKVAMKDLMEKAVVDQEFFQNRMRYAEASVTAESVKDLP
jgi:hypothetical protein